MENPYLLDLFPNTQNQRVTETDQDFDIAPEVAAKMNLRSMMEQKKEEAKKNEEESRQLEEQSKTILPTI